MFRKYVFTLAALSLLLIGEAVTARAGDSCQPVFDALDKVTITPRHTYTTLTAAFTHGKPRASETIVAEGKVYIRVDEKWRPSPASLQDMQEQQKENRQHTKGTCQFVRNEMVGTETAAVYSIHTQSEGAKEDSQIWISKTSGLPLRDEQEIDVGGAFGKEHRSTRFEYGNIRPPM